MQIMSYSENPLLANKAAGRRRDEILANVLANSTSRFLQKIEFKTYTHGLDLGCGVGGVTLRLKSLMGQDGHMIGIDSNLTNVHIAREKATSLNQTKIEFHHKNMASWRPTTQYDFVYSRLLFNRLSRPLEVMDQIFNSLNIGGSVMIEDMDLSNYHCYPHCFAFDRYVELVADLKKRQGGNAMIGNQLSFLLRKTGFAHVQVQVVHPHFMNADGKRIPSLSLENIADALLAEKLVEVSELQALLFELKTFENHPESFITLPGIYQAWGYKGKL